MEKKEIFEKARSIIAEFGLNVEDPSKVKLDSNFDTDLSLDSLDKVEILMALEDEFSIEIPDERAQKCATVSDLVDLVHELID